jgi:hypothetical protein
MGYLQIGYGISANMDLSIIAANLSAVLFGLFYVQQFIRHNSGFYDLRKYFAGLGCVCFLVTVVISTLATERAQTVLGIVNLFVSLAFFGGPLSAIKDVINTSSTQNLPLPTAIATTVNCALWIGYSVLITGDAFVFVPNIMGLAAGCAQLALFAHYGVQQSVDDPLLKDAATKLAKHPGHANLLACL